MIDILLNKSWGIDTLDSYIEKYTSLVPFLNPPITDEPASDPAPEDQTTKAISLQVLRRSSNSYARIEADICIEQTPVIFDGTPIGKKFGSVIADVNTSAYHAGDTVVAQFVG